MSEKKVKKTPKKKITVYHLWSILEDHEDVYFYWDNAGKNFVVKNGGKTIYHGNDITEAIKACEESDFEEEITI